MRSSIALLFSVLTLRFEYSNADDTYGTDALCGVSKTFLSSVAQQWMKLAKQGVQLAQSLEKAHDAKTDVTAVTTEGLFDPDGKETPAWQQHASEETVSQSELTRIMSEVDAKLKAGQSELDAKLKAGQSEVTAKLHAAQAEVDAKLKSAHSSVTEARQEAEVLREELEKTQAQLSALLRNSNASTKAVGFTARLKADSGHGLQFGHSAILPFDDVLLNAGDGYDPHTGIFTAPVAGTYSFFLNLMTTSRGTVSMVKNGNVFDHVYGGNGNDQGATQVLLRLAENDKVWVRHGGGNKIRGGWYTVFTGYLLYAD